MPSTSSLTRRFTRGAAGILLAVLDEPGSAGLTQGEGHRSRIGLAVYDGVLAAGSHRCIATDGRIADQFEPDALGAFNCFLDLLGDAGPEHLCRSYIVRLKGALPAVLEEIFDENGVIAASGLTGTDGFGFNGL